MGNMLFVLTLLCAVTTLGMIAFMIVAEAGLPSLLAGIVAGALVGFLTHRT